MPSFINLKGKKFHRLSVLKRAVNTPRVCWVCRCDCGEITTVDASRLKSGHTKSCGCAQRESVIRRNQRHGEAHRKKQSREYRAWCEMKTRCFNTRRKHYKNYGGRGITICPQWRTNYQQFLQDMGRCPPEMTLDRRDNDLGYFPENCRWATTTEQGNNTRQNHFLTYQGRTLTVAQWERELGFKPNVVKFRIHRGWSTHDALTKPLRRLLHTD